MQEKVFLLGLGNQKCGTSWLYAYLRQSPNFKGGFAKEYHIWDALDTPVKSASRVGLLSAVCGGPSRFRRFRMQNSTTYYLDYFAQLFDEKTKITADITPSYSGLGRERLSFLRDGFASRGVSVKPIILIRDPLSRIKSAVRYNLDRKNYREGIEYGVTDFGAALAQYYKTDHCKLRTEYQNAIRAAWDVFGKDNLYVGVYESMFGAEEIERLSRFTNVPVNLDMAKKYVNKTKSATQDYGDLETEIKRAYNDVYDFCFEHFPQTKTLW